MNGKKIQICQNIIIIHSLYIENKTAICQNHLFGKTHLVMLYKTLSYLEKLFINIHKEDTPFSMINVSYINLQSLDGISIATSHSPIIFNVCSTAAVSIDENSG